MSFQKTFDTFKASLLTDPRTQLCEVSFGGGALVGLAEKMFAPQLEEFARDHRIGFKVNVIEPSTCYVTSSRAFLRKTPDAKSEVVSEAIYGEVIHVYNKQGNVCRVATVRDSYVGWMNVADLGPSVPSATHRFTAPRGHVFAAPSVASERLFELSYGSGLHVLKQDGDWCKVKLAKLEGYVRATLLLALPAQLLYKPKTLVTLAARWLEAPYVWGGTTAWGLDCSGFTQSIYGAFGMALPRDADQQEHHGVTVDLENIQAADLLFFPGHVALSLGGSKIIHANAHHMRVTVDDFEKTGYARYLKEQLVAVRRLIMTD
ncbi:MAG: NlpC/P60 family protein [Trueperaceae bacterium]